jgi:hypothetical protein
MSSTFVQTGPRLAGGYTVYLYVIAVMALMMVFSHQMILTIIREEGENVVVLTSIFRCLQAIELIIFLCALAVAILRSRNSPLAGPTTAAVSILLVMWAPLGTIAFIWWVGWVRRRERAAG